MALIVHKYGGTSMGSTERIRNVAKRVAKWVRAGHQLVVSASIGVALYPHHGKDDAALLVSADHAMYQAKHRGGNQVRQAQVS